MTFTSLADFDRPKGKKIAAASTSVRPTYWLTRFVLLRLLGLVYAFAFFSAAAQIVPLLGADGLLPVDPFFQAVCDSAGSSLNGFLELPSLFWLNDSDFALRLVCWLGFVLSLFVLAGYANALLLSLLWAFYLSLVHAGQDWYGYGWEFQLLETGFLAIFLCPLWDARPFPRREPPLAVIWLFRWLIFRIMLGAGLIKLRGDVCWRDFTALYYHFETQPIPGPLSYFFHFLPKVVLRLGVAFNHLAEVIAPWGVFWPSGLRTVCGLIIICFHLAIILSGNLSFLNWLTIVPAVACLDDAFWARILPRSLTLRAETARAAARPSRGMQTVSWILVGLVTLLSIQPVGNLISPEQVMNTSYDPLHLVNTYGAFGTVGRERYTIVFEGTADPHPADDALWKEYPYLAQPVDPAQMPRQIAPYQPRLDWQIWFAAMATPQDYPWAPASGLEITP